MHSGTTTTLSVSVWTVALVSAATRKCTPTPLNACVNIQYLVAQAEAEAGRQGAGGDQTSSMPSQLLADCLFERFPRFSVREVETAGRERGEQFAVRIYYGHSN